MIHSLTWPQALQAGDKIALTAPSSPVPKANLEAAVASIRHLKLEPVVMPSCRLHHGYLAGPDQQRADDLNEAFAAKQIRGIFCLRGGFGATRLLPLLDFQSIRKNPKVFVGYSDITALHSAINKLCGFVTFHGPMPNTDYRRMDAFTLASLKRNLFSPETLTCIDNPPHHRMEILNAGRAEGMLTGGNLSLLTGTLGSPYEVDTTDKLLFIEDVGERPYRLDKAFTALSLAGKFKDCRGILLGTFSDCEEPPQDTVPRDTVIAADSLQIAEIVKEVILPWGKPVLWNLRAGHIYPQSTLPMGAGLRLDLSDPDLPRISVL